MALSERIKICRQKVGMSQEKVAELVGVSRQAVTKWESGQSAPSTENLFKLAEIFGTTVDMLLESENETKLKTQKRTILNAIFIILGYMIIYFIGRIIWCDISESSFLGWLFTARPSGKHSYLYGWLLSSNLFWYAMAISVVPSVLGKFKFSVVSTLGFVVGIITGMIFGPYPAGEAMGHGHYGWLIWGVIYCISILIGVIVEKNKRR